MAIRTGWTSQGRLWLAGGFTRRIRCGRRGNGQDPCQNFFVQEAISVGSGSKHGMKICSVVLQSTACSRITSSSTAVGFQSGAQSSRQSQPLAAQRIGRLSWNQRLQQMILFRTIPVAEAGRMAPCTCRWRWWTTLIDRAGGGGPADVDRLRSEGCLCC